MMRSLRGKGVACDFSVWVACDFSHIVVPKCRTVVIFGAVIPQLLTADVSVKCRSVVASEL